MTLNLPAALKFTGLLAETSITPLLTTEQVSTRSTKEIIMMLTILALVAAALLMVVVILRRKKIRRLNSLSRSAWPASASKKQSSNGGTIQPRDGHRKRHRHRRQHRPRNPTLADTGGLPPKRPEDQPPSGT